MTGAVAAGIAAAKLEERNRKRKQDRGQS